MEKPTTKKELMDYLKDMTALEITARDSYKKDVALFSNGKLKATIDKIELDEEKHIKLLNDTVKFFEK